ncbi:MAG: DinB family protein [Ginsengibacter sp.]
MLPIKDGMKQFFKDIFEYGHYFNQKLSDIFIQYPDKTSEKSVKLFNHILNAHQIWNNRIEPKQPILGIWEIHPIESCKSMDKTNHENSLLILDKFDLDNTVNYINTKGQSYSNTVRDILFHSVNHSTYHRGQIATEFKLNGLEPLITDYIFYKWQTQ